MVVPVEDEEAQVFFVAEEMPEFPGGELALRERINQLVKYPDIVRRNGIQGKVYVNFIIDKEGRVIRPRIERGVAPSLDKEALRVVSSLPRWKPGKEKGKAVKVSYTVPVNFVIPEK